MAIATRGTAVAAATAPVTTLSITVPAATVIGDFILWQLGQNQATSPATDPTGWTRLQAATGVSLNSILWYKIAASGDAGSTVASPTLTSGQTAAIMAVYSGVDTTNPLDVATPANGSGGTTFVFPAITPVTAGAWVLGAGAVRIASSTTIPPDTNLTSTNLTLDTQHASQQTTNTIHVDLGVGHAAWSSGAFTPTMSSAATPVLTLTHSVALRPATTAAGRVRTMSRWR